MSSALNSRLRFGKQIFTVIVIFFLLTSLAPAAEIVGQWGTGKYKGIHVAGEIACCAASGAGIDIFNIADPDNPILLANFDTTGDSVGVFIADNLVYIADSGNGLQIIDIREPANPVLLGNLETPDTALKVQVVNDKAYIADFQSGLQIIDVSNPEAPFLLGTYNTPGYAVDVFVDGTIAYVADGEFGLQIINVLNPASPQLLGNYDSPGSASGIWVTGAVASLADASKGLQLIDVKDPSQPQLLGSADTYITNIQVVGNTAYVTNGSKGLQVFDISDPDVPTLLTNYALDLQATDKTLGYLEDVFVAGTIAYMAYGSAGLRLADILNPATPAARGYYNSYSGLAADVWVDGSIAYLAAEEAGLQIIDVSNAAEPIRLGKFNEYAKAVQVIGTLAYIGGGGKFYIVDISNPAIPVEVGRCTTSGYARDVHVVNYLAFIAEGPHDLQIISVSDPTTPEIIATYELPGYTSEGVDTVSSLVYVADSDNGLQIIDIQRLRPDIPQIIGNYNTSGNAKDVMVLGTTAYIADSYDGLQIVNVATPSAPSLISNYQTQGWNLGIQVSGNQAYLMNKMNAMGTLQVLDISDPSQPEHLQACDTTAVPQGFHVVGNRAYIADGKSGRLLIMDLEAGNANVYFPHASCTDGWKTEVALINSGSVKAWGRLMAYDDLGQPVADPVSLYLNPRERAELTVNSSFANADEISYLVFETGSHKIVGYTKFYHQTAGYRVALPATTKTDDNTLYISHIASDDDWWTGIALLNTTSATLNPTITFSDGSQKVISLDTGGHRSFSLRDLFNDAPQPQISSAVITGCNGIIGLELFGSIGSGHQLSGISLSGKLTNTIYYPHIASDNNWWTGFVAYDPQAANQSFSITPYSETGISFTPVSINLATGQNKYFNSAAGLNLPANTAWLKVDASHGITGFELFGSNDGNLLGGYTGVGIKSSNGILAKLDQAGWSGIALVNCEAKAVDVTLKARNDQGELVAKRTFLLEAFAKLMGAPEHLFPAADVRSATYISYQSNNELVGFQLNGENLFLDALPALNR